MDTIINTAGAGAGAGDGDVDVNVSQSIKQYRENQLCIDLHPTFISLKESNDLYLKIMGNIKWSRPFSNKRRNNQTYGDAGLKYEIHWYGKTTVRIAQPWLECLLPYKKKLENLTKQEYNVCVIQFYPNGKIGIKPHRDREMTAGTQIACLSLLTKRTLQMARKEKIIDIPILPDSLYILYPPTNDFYSHSILVDNTEEPRMSITFRNYILLPKALQNIKVPIELKPQMHVEKIPIKLKLLNTC